MLDMIAAIASKGVDLNVFPFNTNKHIIIKPKIITNSKSICWDTKN